MDYEESAQEDWEMLSAKTLPSQSSSLEAKFKELDQLLMNDWAEDDATSDDEDSISAEMDPDSYSQLQKELREADESLFERQTTKVSSADDSNDNRDDNDDYRNIESDSIHRSFEESRESQDDTSNNDDIVESHEVLIPGDGVYEEREYNSDSGESEQCVRFSDEPIEIGLDLERPSASIQPQEYSHISSHLNELPEEDCLCYSSCTDPELTSVSDSFFSASTNPSYGYASCKSSQEGMHINRIPMRREEPWETRSWQTFGSTSKYFQQKSTKKMFTKVATPEDEIETSTEYTLGSNNSVLGVAFVENDCKTAVQVEGYVEESHSHSFDSVVQEKYGWSPETKICRSRSMLGLLFCALQITIHIVVLKSFISILTNRHSLDFLDMPPPLEFCEPDDACIRAKPFSFNESTGYGSIIATTEGGKYTSANQNSLYSVLCAFEPHGPTIWYSVIGHGNKLTASIYSESDDFTAVMAILEGGCEATEGIQGPTGGSDSFKTPKSLSWDAIEGQLYSIAVYGEVSETVGFFKLDIWDSRRTEMVLAEHLNRKGNQTSAWTLGCIIGIPCLFAVLTVLSS
jgi:hypothetical protein